MISMNILFENVYVHETVSNEQKKNRIINGVLFSNGEMHLKNKIRFKNKINDCLMNIFIFWGKCLKLNQPRY